MGVDKDIHESSPEDIETQECIEAKHEFEKRFKINVNAFFSKELLESKEIKPIFIDYMGLIKPINRGCIFHA